MPAHQTNMATLQEEGRAFYDGRSSEFLVIGLKGLIKGKLLQMSGFPRKPSAYLWEFCTGCQRAGISSAVKSGDLPTADI